jgi:hypothetical protein
MSPRPQLLLGLLLIASPALADDRPARLRPSRDIEVTYQPLHLGASSGTTFPRHSWRAAAGQVREDYVPREQPLGAAVMEDGYAVWDLRTQTGFRVSTRDNSIRAEAPRFDTIVPPLHFPPEIRFSRAGTKRVAGRRCAYYKLSSNEPWEGEACVTADGAVLLSGGHPVFDNPSIPARYNGVQAVAVRYRRQEPARYARPTGLREAP